MTFTNPQKNNQNNESNDIIIDIPFIAAQVISIAANQTGRSYIQVLAINIFFVIVCQINIQII